MVWHSYIYIQNMLFLYWFPSKQYFQNITHNLVEDKSEKNWLMFETGSMHTLNNLLGDQNIAHENTFPVSITIGRS